MVALGVVQMRQIKSDVGHTCDRFSEPVLKPYGFVLRAVFVVNTWVCVPQECHVDFAVHASKRSASTNEWRNE